MTLNQSHGALGVSGILALLKVYGDMKVGGAGQRPQRGRCPIKHKGELSIHPSIQLSVYPFAHLFVHLSINLDSRREGS